MHIEFCTITSHSYQPPSTVLSHGKLVLDSTGWPWISGLPNPGQSLCYIGHQWIIHCEHCLWSNGCLFTFIVECFFIFKCMSPLCGDSVVGLYDYTWWLLTYGWNNFSTIYISIGWVLQIVWYLTNDCWYCVFQWWKTYWCCVCGSSPKKFTSLNTAQWDT